MKKTYEIPSVEMTHMTMSTILMAGSPGVLTNSGTGTGSIGDPIVISQ